MDQCSSFCSAVMLLCAQCRIVCCASMGEIIAYDLRIIKGRLFRFSLSYVCIYWDFGQNDTNLDEPHDKWDHFGVIMAFMGCWHHRLIIRGYFWKMVQAQYLDFLSALMHTSISGIRILMAWGANLTELQCLRLHTTDVSHWQFNANAQRE